jgi:hypothetical protein
MFEKVNHHRTNACSDQTATSRIAALDEETNQTQRCLCNRRMPHRMHFHNKDQRCTHLSLHIQVIVHLDNNTDGFSNFAQIFLNGNNVFWIVIQRCHNYVARFFELTPAAIAFMVILAERVHNCD